MMGARIRAVILLFALIGGALAFVLDLSTNLFLEQTRRLESRRCHDVLGAWAEGMPAGGVSSEELVEEIAGLRAVLGFDLWVLATPKGGQLAVFPPDDSHRVAGLVAAYDPATMPKEAFACDLDLGEGQVIRFCRFSIDGYGVRGLAVAPAAAFTLRDSPYLDILKIVAAVAWLFLGIAGYFAFTFFFVTPLRRVVHAMEHASTREGGPYLAPEGAPEFQAIARAFNGMVKKQQTNHDKIRYQLDELQRTHRELGTARASLVRSEQLAQVGVLAAGVAHEVGNPLGLVSGYVEMLNEGDVPAEQRALYLSRIDSALDRIQRVLRNLLDFSRRDDDEEDPRASVNAVLGGVLDLVRPQARFRDRSINVEVAKALPLVCIHSGRLEQVLLNLLMNAADAVGPGGHVWVRSEVRGKMLVLFVEDDGEGIEEQELSRIFQPFVTTKEKGTGTGLGLFVCQHLITAYGGEIFASNREEGGARFEFSLWLEDEGSAEGKHDPES